MSSPAAGRQKANAEAQQLRVRLGALHGQILALDPSDPDRWQKLLQDYAVAASALYMTLLSAES